MTISDFADFLNRPSQVDELRENLAIISNADSYGRRRSGIVNLHEPRANDKFGRNKNDNLRNVIVKFTFGFGALNQAAVDALKADLPALKDMKNDPILGSKIDNALKLLNKGEWISPQKQGLGLTYDRKRAMTIINRQMEENEWLIKDLGNWTSAERIISDIGNSDLSEGQKLRLLVLLFRWHDEVLSDHGLWLDKDEKSWFLADCWRKATSIAASTEHLRIVLPILSSLIRRSNVSSNDAFSVATINLVPGYFYRQRIPLAIGKDVIMQRLLNGLIKLRTQQHAIHKIHAIIFHFARFALSTTASLDVVPHIIQGTALGNHTIRALYEQAIQDALSNGNDCGVAFMSGELVKAMLSAGDPTGAEDFFATSRERLISMSTPSKSLMEFDEIGMEHGLL